jgi:hypothetical protein
MVLSPQFHPIGNPKGLEGRTGDISGQMLSVCATLFRFIGPPETDNSSSSQMFLSKMFMTFLAKTELELPDSVKLQMIGPLSEA